MQKIEINGERYIREADITMTDHIIVIAQRNWIFEGYKDINTTDKIRLLNANVIRSWSNGRGIGGFTKEEYKNEYTLDHIGTVEFAPEGVIAIINVEW
jgi:hypothetical protein